MRAFVGSLLLLAAGSAQAATPVFVPGSSLIPVGHHIVNNFNSLGGITTTTPGLLQIFGATDNTYGAIPATGDGNFLSVFGGGNATFLLPASRAVSFDLGSLDYYNTLTLYFVGGGSQSFTGGQIIGQPGTGVTNNGDRFSSTTNGRAIFNAAPGQIISGLRLSSSINSFEIDRLAISPTPEPEAFLSLGVGLALAGFVARRRRRRAAA